MTTSIAWVILTQGDRPDELDRAIESIGPGDGVDVLVVVNAEEPAAVPRRDGVRVIVAGRNLGIPAGRDLGVRNTDSSVIGFLDDDATLVTTDAHARILDVFDEEPELAAVSLRIVDEDGSSARRHVPRVGHRGEITAGRAATHLGGASAIRRAAYLEAGGYWPELVYAHEELDLSWRMHDAGWWVAYLPDIVVEHPRLPISRHADGWSRTGRNRVMVARRNLPWLLAIPHVLIWLALGLRRTPDRPCRRAYWNGWRQGWGEPVERRPIAWRTAWRLARAGRPPIV